MRGDFCMQSSYPLEKLHIGYQTLEKLRIGYQTLEKLCISIPSKAPEKWPTSLIIIWSQAYVTQTMAGIYMFNQQTTSIFIQTSLGILAHAHTHTHTHTHKHTHTCQHILYNYSACIYLYTICTSLLETTHPCIFGLSL